MLWAIKKMRRLIIFILFLRLFDGAFELKAQIKEKTLIIDTLITNEFKFRVLHEDTLSFDTITTHQLLALMPVDSNGLKVNVKRFPNVECKFHLLRSNSKIHISIDNNYGVIEIGNLYNISCDTIRINKLQLNETHMYDSLIVTSATWKENDSCRIESSIRNNNYTKVIKDSLNQKLLMDFEITINNRQYWCEVYRIRIPYHFTSYQGRKRGLFSIFRKNKIHFGGREVICSTSNKTDINIICP